METITLIKLSKNQKFVIIASFVILFFISVWSLFETNDNLREKYPKIDNELVQGYIKTVFTTGGYCYVTLKSGKLFRDNGSENLEYKNDYILGLFLQANDSVYKPAFSDTMYVYRQKSKYYFIIKYEPE